MFGISLLREVAGAEQRLLLAEAGAAALAGCSPMALKLTQLLSEHHLTRYQSVRAALLALLEITEVRMAAILCLAVLPLLVAVVVLVVRQIRPGMLAALAAVRMGITQPAA